MLMQRFLFDVKVMELDGSSKGHSSHHAHVAKRGDTRSDLCTPLENKGCECLIWRVDKGLGGACTLTR